LTSEWGQTNHGKGKFHSFVSIRLSFLVHAPKARPVLEVAAPYEPERRHFAGFACPIYEARPFRLGLAITVYRE
jgi:hypothetical protein